MKNRASIYIGYVLLIGLFGFLPTVNAAPGDLDTSFSGDGKVVDTLLVKANAQGQATAVQADGKIVVAGTLTIGNNGGAIPQRFGCAVARYNTNGSFDDTFDGDGRTVGQIGTTFNCRALAIQTDGKIVVGGGTASSGNSDFAVIRFNSNGSLDTSFGSGGYITNGIETSGSYDTITALAIQADGKIVASGITNATGNSNFAAARYNSNGTLDTTFDSDGKVSTDFAGTLDYAYGLTIQTDGKIIVAGDSAVVGSYSDFALVRYNPNGSLDNSFDGDGKLTIDASNTPGSMGADRAYSVTTQADGKILAAGSAYNTANQFSIINFAIVRLNTNGSLDTSFGSGGKILGDVADNSSYVRSIVVQTDGKIIALGYGSNDGSYSDFTLVRINTDGSLDTTFDGDGIVKTPVLRYDDYAYAVVLQTDGKIVAAGFSGINSDNNFALVRYNTDGSLDTSFDDDGKRTNEMGYPTSSSASKAAIQADGKIVTAGYSFNGANDDFALVRYNVDGSRDSTFGGEGKVTTDITGLIDGERAYAIAIQSDGKIIAAGDTVNYGERSDFALIRYNPDGSRDTSFGNNGIVTTGFSTNSYDFVRDLVIQPDGKIIAVGASTNSSNNFDFALARYNPNGSLDTSFDGDGKVITPISNLAEEVRAIAIQTDGKIIAAGYASSNTSSDFALVRYNTDGSLDTSFDTDGIVTTDISGTSDGAVDITIQTDGKIIAAGSSYNGSNTDFTVVRYNPNGSLDNSFDTDGKVTTNITVSESANGVAVQTDGKIIAGGATYSGSGGNDGAIVRYNSNGSLDTSFGTGGIRIFDMFAGSNDFFYGMTLDSIGRAVMIGETSSASDSTKRIAVARILTDFAPRLTPFDFDGDGKTDISIFRPAQGEWWYSRSSDGGNRAFTFGNSADKLVPGDYTGDGKTDIAFWRPTSGEWFILRSEDVSYYSFPLGASGDIPAPFDYDGDGKTDAAVFRPSNATWYINKSSGGTQITSFGAPGDVPAVGDYDGDGKADIAIHRPSVGQWWIQRSSNASVYAFNLGNSTDKPVQGDYTGDGKTDAAIWRPSTGEWFILRSESLSFYSVPFGINGDSPVAGDYDGDGKFDIGVFRPSSNTWFINRSTAGVLITNFGINGDKPVPNVFVP